MYCFTDGSCIKNGKKNASGGCSYYIHNSELPSVEFCKKVEPNEFLLIDSKLTLDESKTAAVTNNRAEYLGLIHLLQYLIENEPSESVYIVSDSNLTIKTLTEWLPNRKKKNTAHQLKNYDLVMIADCLLQILKSICSVEFIHINSHQREPDDKDSLAWLLWYGNNIADRLAGSV